MQSMDFKEFYTEKCKKRTKKKAKVNNSWGVYDIYKHIRKNQWYDIGRPLKEHEFYAIIRGINTMLAKELSNGNSIAFPCKMGVLELRKSLRGVSIVDGELRNTYPVNWYETMQLWYTDEEERNKKTLIRNESPTVFKVKYNKYRATYENKVFYEFSLNRGIKKALKDNINEGRIETLW